jgi:hypothetical protein
MTRHSRVTKTPRAATVHNAIKESGRDLPHPSACLPHDSSTDIRGWHVHYPSIHHCRRGEVSFNSAIVEATNFAGPHKSHIRQHIINACSTWPTDTGRGYHLGAPNMKTIHSHPSHLVFFTTPKLPHPISY